jgi:hypothetical protein
MLLPVLFGIFPLMNGGRSSDAENSEISTTRKVKMEMSWKPEANPTYSRLGVYLWIACVE